MELKSQFDYKSLRKKQQVATRNFNRVAKGVDKLGLNKEDTATIEGILTRQYDSVMQRIQAGESIPGVTDDKKAGQDEAPADKPAEGAFV